MKSQSLHNILLLSIGIAVGAIAMAAIQILGADDQSIEKSLPAASAPSTSKPLSITVTMPREDVVLDGIRAVGTLLPIEDVNLSTEVTGKVTAILFEEGEKVKKGQPLITINDDDLQAKMQRYTHQERTLAEKLERQRILLDREAVSQEAYDAVETEYNVLRADMEVLKVEINRSTVRAPFDGVIGLRYVSEGAYLQPSSRIARLVDQSKLLVEFSIPEKYISTPLVGKKIFFTTEGSDRRNEAHIYAIEPRIDEATRTIILRAEFNNAAGRIRPGMSTRVTIPTSTEATRLLIPTETIVPTMSGKSVWVVTDGRASERTVTTGVRTEKEVEVLSGLLPTDSIILNGIMHVREGLPVAVKNEANPKQQ